MTYRKKSGLCQYSELEKVQRILIHREQAVNESKAKAHNAKHRENCAHTDF